MKKSTQPPCAWGTGEEFSGFVFRPSHVAVCMWLQVNMNMINRLDNNNVLYNQRVAEVWTSVNRSVCVLHQSHRSPFEMRLGLTVFVPRGGTSYLFFYKYTIE